MKFLKLIILAFLFLCGCTDVNTIVHNIEQHNLLESEYIGFAGVKSEEYKRYKTLSSISSDNELEQLSNHLHPIVRTYAFQIMLERKLIESDEAFEKALSNNETFKTLSADIMSQSDVCSEIYFKVLNRNRWFDEEKMEYITIQNTEMNKLDSLVIYDIDEDHILHYLALDNKKHSSSINTRIKELALKKRVPSAVNYIDRNKIKVDTLQMINSMEYILENIFIGSEPEERMRMLLEKYKA